jgi:hypothetical protein
MRAFDNRPLGNEIVGNTLEDQACLMRGDNPSNKGRAGLVGKHKAIRLLCHVRVTGRN